MYEILVSHTETSMLVVHKIVNNKALKEIKNKEESPKQKANIQKNTWLMIGKLFYVFTTEVIACIFNKPIKISPKSKTILCSKWQWSRSVEYIYPYGRFIHKHDDHGWHDDIS